MSPTQRRGKVLLCKVGLDGHEAGAKLVARVLVDAGYEVVYTGRRTSVAQVVAAALQEDVDLIGVSLLSGTHLTVASDLMAALATEPDPPAVVMGGIIPPEDHAALGALGVRAVLGPGSSPQQIVSVIDDLLGATPHPRGH